MLTGIIPTTWQPQLQAALRIVTGLLFMEHGTSKVLHFPINEMLSGMYSQMGGMTMGTGLVDLVGGILIVIGAFTRPVAFVLSGYMAAAFFLAHVSMGGIFPILNFGEAAVLFSFIFLYFAATGAGPYSVDASRGN